MNDPAAFRPEAHNAGLRFIEAQQPVLALIASRAPIQQILEALVRLVEEQSPDMRCAILLADPQQSVLRFAAADSVPEDYKAGFGCVRIAPDAGSCGAAAYLRQPVYTRDTATDDGIWRQHGELAVRNGIRAVWSTPILSTSGAVLGTLAMYYGQPRLPSEAHIQLIAAATQLTRIALEANADRDLLHGIFEEAPYGIIAVNLADESICVNPAFARLLGYEPAELAGKALADITPAPDHASLRHAAPGEGGNVAVAGRRRYCTKDGRILVVGERTSVHGSASAHHRVSRIEWAMPQGDDPLERLSRRERQVLRLVIEGSSSKEIAARLRISPTSVDTYRGRIMVKLNLRNMPDLVRFAIDHGLEVKAAA
jgi:PAS domain S-box-containing protein